MAPDSNWQCRSCGARNPVDATTCADCGVLHVPAAGAYDAMALLRDASLMRTTADATGLPAAASAPSVDRKQAAFASTTAMPNASVPASAPPIAASQVGAQTATRDSADGRAAVSRATMLLPAARMPIAESTVETGSVPVAMLTSASDPAQRRREIPAGRVLPVVMMSALGFVALLGVALWLRGSEVRAEYGGTAPPERPQHEPGTLPETDTALQNPLVTLVAAPEFQAGLTEDNKETVLVLCNRVSENPNVECRRSYLQQLGEYPARPVAMPALQVHQQEVSNHQYEQCVQVGVCSPQDWQACRFHSIYRYEFGRPVPDVMRQPDHPAVCVTFEQAHEYCASQGMMLPTADEWERIARAGDDRLFPWGSHWAPGILNWGEYDMSAFPIPGRLDGHEFTAPAVAFDDGATPEGVYNMLGNAAEWVWLAERQANGTPVAAAEDGSGGAPGSPVGIRGGSYANHVLDMRLTRSIEIPAEQARSTIGFRCVRDVP